jgi:hypothetical protein
VCSGTEMENLRISVSQRTLSSINCSTPFQLNGNLASHRLASILPPFGCHSLLDYLGTGRINSEQHNNASGFEMQDTIESRAQAQAHAHIRQNAHAPYGKACASCVKSKTRCSPSANLRSGKCERYAAPQPQLHRPAMSCFP